MERVHGLIDRDPAGVPGRPLGLLRLLRVWGSGAVPRYIGRDGHRARGRRERLRRAHGGRLERRAVVEQEGFQGLAEVVDEMKAVDDLHRLGCPPANAIRIEVTAITTDDGDRRMLGQPGRDAGGRAVRQQVHDAMRRQIDQDGAIPMAPPPGPLVDPNGLQGWHGRDRGPPDQAEQGGWTGGEPQAGREPGASVPAQRQADRPQGCDQSMGVAAIGRDEVRQALGEDPTPAGPIAAEEFPHGQLDPDGARPPWTKFTEHNPV